MSHYLSSMSRFVVLPLALILVACGTSKLPPATYHADLAATSPSAERDADIKTAPSPKIKRRVIKTAVLELISSEPRDGLHKAIQMAKQMGGYTLDSHQGERRLRVTLRIPARHFEQALRRLAKLGKVDQRSISGKDVTIEVVDLSMRLKNAQRMRQRYLELLKRAENVHQVLAVQKELERITATIESLKGRISVIESQVSMSTIRLTLKTPTAPGPVGWVFYGLYKGIVWLFVWN
jgi:hypothetical protein